MSGYKIFDGHNDTLLRLEMNGCSADSREFFDGNDFCHIDYPKAVKGGLIGGFFAMWAPSKLEETDFSNFNPADPANFAEVEQQGALRVTNAMFARALRLEKASRGRVGIVRSANDIRQNIKNNVFSMLMHIEGAEAIDADFKSLEVLYAAGLRSIGPVWSRNNIFAEGVPMHFPGSPDTGAGLSDKGRELIKVCNQMGIMLDMSHLNEKGFWDTVRLSDAPIVATHSNVHAICPSPRNLTDSQLEAIADSKGVVGLNFNVGFVRPDGARNPDTPLSEFVNHLAYLVEKLGESGVALGSDFDGATMPKDIHNASTLNLLAQEMEKAQFGSKLINKICHENWIDVLERTLK